ncbi:AAA family ATPase [Saccharopolyspora sp. 5N102]|uniref:nSTAND1 domain-containing NTPase n=1 Tax=Saccharopolyspora sp. 5N102 TaxID=3375155 RepID=UPI003798ADF6
MARQERPLRDFTLLLYGAGLGFLTNLATNSAEGWGPPFNLIRDHSEYLLGAGVVVPAAYYVWRQRKLSTAHDWDAGKQGNPYPGLQSFGPEHEKVFFGRDRAKQELYEKLGVPGGGPEDRFLLVAGSSGSGKSSLVNAGLASLLRRRHWSFSSPLKPGRDPFGELVHVLQGELSRAEGDVLIRGLRAEARRALERLRSTDDPRSERPEVLDSLLRRMLNTNRPAALLIDQAEELVTQVDAQTRQEFMALLHAALADNRRLHVVATMRAEFIADFLPEPSGALLRNPYFVTRLNRAELRQIITVPARKAGVEIERDAVDAMVDDATEAGADVLPLLAHLLHNLYEDFGGDGRITLQEYEESGRVEKAISSTADKVLARLSRQYDEEKVMRTLLRFVSWASHAEDPTRNRVRVDDLDADEQHIVQEFLEERLLVDGAEGERDIAHEALLRQWEPLRERVEEQRPLLRQRTVFEQRALEWEQSGREADLLLPESQVDAALAVEAKVECSKLLGEYCAASSEARSRALRQRAINLAATSDQLRESSPQTGLILAREAVELSSDRSTALSLWARLRDPLVWSAHRHASDVLDVWWDDNGRLHAVDRNGMAMVHDLNSVDPVMTRRFLGARGFSAAAWSDDATLVYGTSNGDVGTWDLDSDGGILHYQHDKAVRSVSLSSRNWIASGGQDKVVLVHDSGGSGPRSVHEHSETVTAVAWSPDGTLLASCSEDGAVQLWDSRTGESRILHAHLGQATCLAWSADGWLASGGESSTVKVFDVRSGSAEVIREYTGYPVVQGLAWSSDGRLAIARSTFSGCVLSLWNRRKRSSAVLRYRPGPDVVLMSWQQGKGFTVAQRNGALAVLSPDDHHTNMSQAWQPSEVTAGAASSTALFTLARDGHLRRASASGRAAVVGTEKHFGDADQLAWSSNGILASASAMSGDNALRIWDPRTQESRRVHTHDQPINSIAWSADGKLLASGGDDQVVRVSDHDAGVTRVVHESARAISAVAWSPSGVLASGSHDGKVRIWDLRTGATRVVLTHSDWVRAIAWSPDGLLASGGDDGVVQLWDPATDTAQVVLRQPGWVRSLAWSDKGSLACGCDKVVSIWGRSQSLPVEVAEHDVRFLAWSPQGELASGWENGEVRLFRGDVGGRSESHALHRHPDSVSSLVWSRGGVLASTSGDDEVFVWDSSSDTVRGLKSSQRSLAVAWSPQGELTTADGDARIRIWKPDFEQHREVRHHGGPAGSIAISGSRKIATGGYDGEIRLWNEETGSSQVVLRTGQQVAALAWAADGRLAYVKSGEQEIEIWAPDTGSATAWSRTSQIDAMAWSSRGVLATGGPDFVVRLWEPGNMRPRELRRHTAPVHALLWIADDRLVTGGADGLLVWDTTTGQVVVIGDEVEISRLGWSPGMPLASADREGRIRLWDLETGNVVATVPAHDERIVALGWLDGGRLVSAGEDRLALTWTVETDAEALLREADERGVRRLTDQERARFGPA